MGGWADRRVLYFTTSTFGRHKDGPWNPRLTFHELCHTDATGCCWRDGALVHVVAKRLGQLIPAAGR